MAIFEVWKSKTGIEMTQRGAKRIGEPDEYLLHTFEAHTTFEAFRTHYQLMGWGEWKAPPDLEDEPVPPL